MNVFSILRNLVKSIFFAITFIVFYHTLVRLVRRYYKFPIPHFLANVIDNPVRRRLQPPETTAIRHGIKPGMTVLEIGPGNGSTAASWKPLLVIGAWPAAFFLRVWA